MKTRKGFTLVELLVVIGIIALLMGILMPALAKVKAIAVRMVCGTNLKDLGKACYTYANDNKDQFPVSGGPSAKWGSTGTILDWAGETEIDAFGQPSANNNQPATVSSCLFLLIKYQNSAPAQFNCGGDVGVKEFKLSLFKDTKLQNSNGNTKDMSQLWDFGDPADARVAGDFYPGNFVTYAYAMPFKFMNTLSGATTRVSYPVSSLSNAKSPLMADRNPWCDVVARGTSQSSWLCDRDGKIGGSTAKPHQAYGEYTDQERTGNSACHQRDGQNVLFADISSNFAKSPNVGIENDHIYVKWTVISPSSLQRQGFPDGTELKFDSDGTIKANGIGKNDAGPVTSEDAFLVNEYNGDPTAMN